jgi:predicted nucleic acid-binding protein
MMCIADANVLFPLLVEGHAAHGTATEWWQNQPDGAVGTCLLTRLAVLRLLSNRVAMNGNPVKPKEALSAWQQLADDPRSVRK